MNIVHMEISKDKISIPSSVNPTVIENKGTFSNNAGRPKKNKEIKFGPQPKSIVAQLLIQEKARIKEENEKRNYITEHYQPSEVNSKSSAKKRKSKNIKKYTCKYPPCPYTTTSSSNMIKHTRRHTKETPYMCDQCTFRTKFINSLKVHKRIHSGDRPFICEHCSYRCNSSSNLKKHCMLKHTGIT